MVLVCCFLVVLSLSVFVFGFVVCGGSFSVFRFNVVGVFFFVKVYQSWFVDFVGFGGINVNYQVVGFGFGCKVFIDCIVDFVVLDDLIKEVDCKQVS